MIFGMTPQLELARKAIGEEIKRLAGEQTRLKKVLAALNGSGSRPVSHPLKAVGAPAAAVKRRGRPRKSPAPQPGDVDGAIELIKAAGKDGINAIGLSYQIKNAGITKPSKAELLDSGKVKASGKGGGIVYKFVR